MTANDTAIKLAAEYGLSVEYRIIHWQHKSVHFTGIVYTDEFTGNLHYIHISNDPGWVESVFIVLQSMREWYKSLGGAPVR